MKRILIAAALAALVLSAAACGSSSSAPPALSPYTQAVNTMQANCTQSSDQLESTIGATYQKLTAAGVADLSVASVATGMADMTAGNTSPADCSDEFADYVSQQEGR